MEVESINYFHVTFYLQCQDCSFKVRDFDLKSKFTPITQDKNNLSMVVSTHCPKCDSTFLSPITEDDYKRT